MLTIGFIGNGKSTNRYHLPYVLNRKDTFNVKTIFNHQIKTFNWDKIDGIFYTDDLEDLLGDPEIDLVVVCTRQDLHFEYAKKVLEHGKHCLVEKPFMESSHEAKEIFDLARAQGCIVQAYQNRRYDSDFLTVQKVIESGKLGDLLEVEMHFDYYRPEVPESIHTFHPSHSYLYGHGCHTLDQVLSYFGNPDRVNMDVRQLLGPGRFNDYFDIDLYYGVLKVSVKSSYYRIKPRPSFIVYGKNGMFVKATKDRQETDLKQFKMPWEDGFGVDEPKHYGVLTYRDETGEIIETKVKSEQGDYGRIYDDLYDAIKHGKPIQVTHAQTLKQMELLEQGIKDLY